MPTLEEITEFTLKGKALKELQSLRQVVVAGDSATTNIPIADVTVKNTTILSVVEVAHDPAGGGAGISTLALDDRTSEAEITSDGNLQLDTTDTTGSTLLVWLREKPSG